MPSRGGVAGRVAGEPGRERERGLRAEREVERLGRSRGLAGWPVRTLNCGSEGERAGEARVEGTRELGGKDAG